MKPFIASAMVATLLLPAVPAAAQFGGLDGVVRGAQRAQEAKQKLDDLTFTDEEERQIGEDVSAKIRARFGVVQDSAVHKYVTLVGTVVAQGSSRPQLPWTFVVLDTDGVNAFASPGGFVHITRGALGLIQNEAELAGVLGHEVGHIVNKHTINALRKSNAVRLGTDAAGRASGRAALLANVANAAYSNILENAYDRGDELDADRQSVQLAEKAGYRAGTLGDFLTRLAERNKDQPNRNGLFASHPETKERISRIAQSAKATKTAALVQPRYKAAIPYQPTPMTAISVIEDGAAGLTGAGSSGASADEKKAAEKKQEPRRGLGLGALRTTVGQEKQSTQVSASGGARGVEPDRGAKGGDNPALVRVSVSQTELDAFRKGIA